MDGLTEALYAPTDPTYLADPAAHLHRLRAQDPVHWSDEVGAWVLSRHDDCSDVARDGRFSFVPKGVGANLTNEQAQALAAADPAHLQRMMEVLPRCFNWMDPPDHARIRRLVVRAFGKRAVTALRPRIRERAVQLLDRVADPAGFDLHGDLAFPLPYLVICDMLGFADDLVDDVQHHMRRAELMMAPNPEGDVFTEGVRSFAWLVDQMESLIEQRRQVPADDLVTALVEVESQEDHLVGSELVATVLTVFGAATSTTQRLIGNGMVALLRAPDEYVLLAEDVDRNLAGAVEEMLRYHHPDVLTNTPRLAPEDLEIRGRTIRAGDSVRLLLGAANRDPEVFDDPDRFDITRDPNPHLTFGAGAHACVGSQLARVEAQEVVTVLLERHGTSLRLLDPDMAGGPQLLADGFRSIPVGA